MSKKGSPKRKSIWELEESLDYSSLSDEMLDELYNADQMQRERLLKKRSRKQHGSAPRASKKSKGSAKNRASNSDSALDWESYDEDEFQGDYDD